MQGFQDDSTDEKEGNDKIPSEREWSPRFAIPKKYIEWSVKSN